MTAMIDKDGVFALWQAFGARVQQDFPRVAMPKIPTTKEREYLDEMLQEYEYPDLVTMFDVAVRDWDRVRSTWPTVVKVIIPSFVPVYLLRRDLMAIATAGRAAPDDVGSDNESVQSTG